MMDLYVVYNRTLLPKTIECSQQKRSGGADSVSYCDPAGRCILLQCRLSLVLYWILELKPETLSTVFKRDF
jgi:hypothetical protein